MFRRLPNPATLTPEQRIEYRNAIVGKRYNGNRIDLADGSCYYANDDGPGRFMLHAFAGLALRPSFIESCRTRERLDERIAAFLASRERTARDRAGRLAERSKRHSLRIGDILNTCWGYEQINVEFYEVVGVRSSQVLIRQLAAETIPDDGLAPMTGRVQPLRGEYVGAIIRKRATGGNAVRIENYITATPWDGKPCRMSSYG